MIEPEFFEDDVYTVGPAAAMVGVELDFCMSIGGILTIGGDRSDGGGRRHDSWLTGRLSRGEAMVLGFGRYFL